ncbi:MAG: FliO/MopB family protein [bacterium]
MIKEKTDQAISNSLFDNDSGFHNAEKASEKESALKVEDSIMSKAFQSVLVLASVLGLAILCLYLFKCFIYGKHKLGASGKLLVRKDSLYLAPKQSLSLIEVAGQWLVIGITPTSMTTLAQIQAPLDDKKNEEIKNKKERLLKPNKQIEYNNLYKNKNSKQDNSNFSHVLRNLQNNLTSLKKV